MSHRFRRVEGGVVAAEGTLGARCPPRDGMMMRDAFTMRAFIVALVVSALVCGTHAKLLAVDMGSDTTKIALVKPGRTPISLVTNEMSKRKTPTKVSFSKGVRLFGEAAANLEQRYPSGVFTRIRDALGSDSASSSKALYERTYRPYVFNETAPSSELRFRIDTGEEFNAEELVGMMLEYFSQLGTEFANSRSPIRDMALVVPSYLGMRERHSLLNAAQVAGIKVLGFINTATAAALHYAKDRTFADPELILFFNFGAAYSEAALIRFEEVKDRRKAQPVTSIEVLDLDWNADVGAETFDIVLANHFAAEYNAKFSGTDVTTVPKAMSKLKKACKKTKEVLSANSEAPISIESMHDDNDFRSSIKRAAFEELIAADVDRVVAPLKAILERNGVPVANLTGVEMLGGGTRIPAVQTKLTEALGGRHLDRHLDADEAAVMGASLFAANASTSFVLKKMFLYEKFPYAIDAEAPTNVGVTTQTILPRLSKTGESSPFVVTNVTEDFVLTLKYGNGIIPPGAASAEIGTYNVTGFAKVNTTKYNASESVSLIADLDPYGNVWLAKASTGVSLLELYNETIKPENKTVPAAAANVTVENATVTEETTKEATNATEATIEATDGEANATSLEGEEVPAAPTDGTAEANETAAPEPTVVTKIREKKRTIRLDAKWLNKRDYEASYAIVSDGQKRLKDLLEADNDRKLAEKVRNDLESFILATMPLLDSDDGLMAASTEAQRDEIKTLLMDGEDWMYAEGENANATTLQAKMDDIKVKYLPIQVRAMEAEERPDAIERFKRAVTKHREAIAQYEETRPWLSAEHIANATALVDEKAAWLEAQESIQAKVAPHEDPSLTLQMLSDGMEVMAKRMKKLKNIKKPKPPKPEKPENEEEEEEEEEAPADAAAEGGSGEGANATQGEGEGAQGSKGDASGEEPAAEAAGEEASDEASQDYVHSEL